MTTDKPAKVIRLRYAGTCNICRIAVAAHTNAWWDPGTRATTCLTCRPATGTAATNAPPMPPIRAPSPLEPRAPIETGVAGGSARLEYEKRHQRREQAIDERWGRFAGIVKFLSDDPQSTTAWAKGSEGERLLAQRLQNAVGDRAVVLHDRKVPGTRGNIDHIAIAESGVWVIDAKRYKGRVEQRDVGGWFRTDKRVYVGKRDRTTVVNGLGWQVDAVRTALEGVAVPIAAAVCFVDGDWKLFPKPFRIDNVWVTWPKKLADLIGAPGPLTPTSVSQIAGRIAQALPPKIQTR